MTAIVASIVSQFDATGVERASLAFNQLSSRTKSVSDGIRAATIPATIAFAAVTAGIGSSISAASDLNEEINKVNVVFGKSGAEILSWSENSAKALGMSRTEALAATGQFGAMFTSMGYATGAAATMSTSLVQLAADMASFNNASPVDTLAALRSGLAGESEPLRKFQVFLSQARIEQVALNQGLWDGKGNLDAAAKAAATYAIIMDDTALAQGDMARTANGVANEQRFLAASMKDASAALGTLFLPFVRALLPVLTHLADLVREHSTLFAGFAIVVVSVSGAILTAAAALKAYKIAADAASAATALLNLAMTNLPLLAVAAAVAAVTYGMVQLYQHSDTARAVMDTVARAAAALGRILYQSVVEALQISIDTLAKFITVAGTVVGSLGFISGKARAAGDAMKAAGDAVAGFSDRLPGHIRAAVAGTASALGSAVTAGRSLGGGISAGATSAISTQLPAGIARSVGDAATKAGGAAKDAGKKVGDELKKRLTDALAGTFGRYQDKALRAFDAETSALTDRIRSNLDTATAAVESRLKASRSRIDASLKASLKALGVEEAALTPEEQALANAEALRDETKAARELADAQDELAAAITDGTDARKIADAQARLSDLMADREIDRLRALAVESRRIKADEYEQRRADAERDAQDRLDQLDAQAADEITKLKEQADARIMELQSERDLRREILQDQLDDLETHLEKQPDMWTSLHSRIMALFRDSFGPEYEKAGANLGAAFARGLAMSEAAVGSAAAALAGMAPPNIPQSVSGSYTVAQPFTVNVNAGIGTNGAAVGRQIVSTLQDYTKQNGKIIYGGLH